MSPSTRAEDVKRTLRPRTVPTMRALTHIKLSAMHSRPPGWRLSRLVSRWAPDIAFDRALDIDVTAGLEIAGECRSRRQGRSGGLDLGGGGYLKSGAGVERLCRSVPPPDVGLRVMRGGVGFVDLALRNIFASFVCRLMSVHGIAAHRALRNARCGRSRPEFKISTDMLSARDPLSDVDRNPALVGIAGFDPEGMLDLVRRPYPEAQRRKVTTHRGGIVGWRRAAKWCRCASGHAKRMPKPW